MLHGAEQLRVQLSFEIPSRCATTVEQSAAHAGLVPVAEVARQGLDVLTPLGISCRGAVRSILLVSRVPVREIKTLAADLSSRTSSQLARVILREMYGVAPEIVERPPELGSMIAECDAALLIGDSALRLDPYTLPYEVLDLGAEWYALTGLPMVFALWAGRSAKDGAGVAQNELAQILERSYRFGRDRIEAIVDQEYGQRRVTRELAHEYLTRYIRFEIGDAEWKGLETFLELAGLPQVELALAEAR